MHLKLTCLLLALAALPGCSELDNCPDEGKPIVINTGTTDLDSLMYWSASLNGPRDAFPAKTTLHFTHDLGVTPEVVNTYVAFKGEGSDVSENTGNQGRIKCVDDREIVIKNDTCEESFYIVVTAQASGNSHAPCTCVERILNGGTCPEALQSGL